MDIRAHYTVAKIENGYLVTDVAGGRVFHTAYEFGIGREVEKLFHETVQVALDGLAKPAAVTADELAAASAVSARFAVAPVVRLSAMQQDED